MTTNLVPAIPTSKQLEFLNLTQRDALYTGSAGSGKTYALLLSAAQYLDHSHYRALILCRHENDLHKQDGILSAASQLWPNYKLKNSQFVFPNGAKLTCGSYDRPSKYINHKYHCICVDGLTQWEEADVAHLHQILHSNTSSIPVRFRAATNPGGVGHDWVKRTYITDPDLTRVGVVHASHLDNPHFDYELYASRMQRNSYPISISP